MSAWDQDVRMLPKLLGTFAAPPGLSLPDDCNRLTMLRCECITPPPGLEPPANSTMITPVPTFTDEEWAAPAKVYPSKPPGFFGSLDTASNASTDLPMDHSEDLPEQRGNRTEAPCKEWSRDLRINHNQGRITVDWPVDAATLKKHDKQIISPSMEIAPGFTLKAMLKPRAIGDRKNQASFHRARGRGFIELKCVEGSSSAPRVTVLARVGISSDRAAVIHDFSEKSVAQLAEADEAFDFRSAIDRATSSFIVRLEVQIHSADDGTAQ